MTAIIGIVRAAGPQAAIAGGPTPLLQTGEGSLLECAIRKVSPFVSAPTVVTVRTHQEPVAAQARRQGAQVLFLPPDGVETEEWIVEALADTIGFAPGTRLLLLRVDAPLIAPETLQRLAEATIPGAAGADPGPDHGHGPDPDHGHGHDPGPLVKRGLAGLVPVHDAGDGPDPERAGVVRIDLSGPCERPFAPPNWFAIPVPDRHVNVRLRDVATYRRHFPDAFRRRFQKW
jgi:molybdopterin-guanine dinucleotide biosynthesis protein A